MKLKTESTQQPQIIDRAAVERLRQFDDGTHGDTLCELVKLFLQLAPKRIEQMKISLEKLSWRDLSREAHSLKSSSANLGAMRLSAACRRLETIENHPDTELARSLLDEIQDEYLKASEALTEMMTPATSSRSVPA